MLSPRNTTLIIAAVVVAVAGALLLWFLAFSPSAAQASTTVLTVISGDVRVQHAESSQPRAAADGETLTIGDRVITGADGHAAVTFFEGSTQILEPSTEITIRRIASAAGSGLLAGIKQGAGTTWSTVFNTSDARAQYEIETPAVVAAVRDTMFLVQVAADGATTVWSRQGTVAVTAQGVEVLVHAGERSVTKPGDKPGTPESFAPPNGELKIGLGANAHLLIASPDGLAAGLTAAGMPVNQIPLGLIGEPSAAAQTISLMSLSDGVYQLYFGATATGDAAITVQGTTSGNVTCDAHLAAAATNGQNLAAQLTLSLQSGVLAGCQITQFVPTNQPPPAKYVIPDPLARAVLAGRALWPPASALAATPAAVGASTAASTAPASPISMGAEFTCSLEVGGAWCWGGVPRLVPGLSSGVSAMDAGDFHVCAVKDGGVWCFGPNSAGELGIGSTGGPDTCIVLKTNVPCQIAPVPVPAMASGVTAISAGGLHTCTVKDGGAWCWGGNMNGQLGNNSTTNSSVPVAVVGLTSGVTAISAGRNHTCALKDGGAWCWGDNSKGELGDNTTTDRLEPVPVIGLTTAVTAISAGSDATCALKNDGSAWCWGSNGNGQLGNSGTIDSPVPVAVSGMTSGVTAISAGWLYTCAVKDAGAWCWGGNQQGELGNNSKAQSDVPVPVVSLASGVTAISASGNWHTCAAKDGNAWCWGANNREQLGDGTFDWSLVPVAVMGLPTNGGAYSPPIVTAPTAAAGDEENRLMAAIRATYPGREFTSTCTIDATHPSCNVAGGWSADTLASGIASIGFQSTESAARVLFARMADGSWAYWATIANGGGGPLASLPGDAMVCADGDGLNLRAEPSTSAALVVLLPDGVIARADKFVLTEPSRLPGGGVLGHGHGWYHVVAPQDGWAYDRYLVPVDERTPQGASPTDINRYCTAQWWHRDP